MTVAVGHPRATTQDGVLVQEAAAGSGVSYGALYDRYATQVFNYCLRLTGSPEDAADATQEAFVNVLRRLQDDERPVLDFSSYLFAAARHESYGLMRQRARLRPSDTPPEERGHVADIETDPERAALLHDAQKAVREANARLAPRHREVLALREVAGRSYDEIGQIMGISGNAAAQLIFRARAKLREAITAGAVASVVATSYECETAQVLLNRLQDSEPVDEADRVWLEEHLEECGSCRAAKGVLFEAGLSYRSWLPVALLPGMRSDTLTRAGELVGADWSTITPTGQAGASGVGGMMAAAPLALIAAVGAFVAITGGNDSGQIASRGERLATGASAASAQRAPARGYTARAGSAEAGAELATARAPRAGEAPAAAVPPGRMLRRSEGVAAPESPGAAPRRPENGSPPPTRDNPAPRAPTPSDPRGESAPTPPTPVKPAPTPPADAAPPVPTLPPASDCSWPGRGRGPADCPPGHGGEPKGHGGEPKGNGGEPKGNGGGPKGGGEPKAPGGGPKGGGEPKAPGGGPKGGAEPTAPGGEPTAPGGEPKGQGGGPNGHGGGPKEPKGHGGGPKG